MEDPDDLSFLPEASDNHIWQAQGLTEEDIVGAVADLLTSHGYQFIPDAKLPEMKQALQPFLVTA